MNKEGISRLEEALTTFPHEARLEVRPAKLNKWYRCSWADIQRVGYDHCRAILPKGVEPGYWVLVRHCPGTPVRSILDLGEMEGM